MKLKKRILVAPLNWGLGHATRCVPIINALISHNFEPIIASDGNALALLKKEFPKLNSVELPAYNITYAKQGKHLKLKLLKDVFKLLKAIKDEKKTVEKIIESYAIDGIISDNRFGVYSKKKPSVYITHQINVLSGNTTALSTKLHQHIIKKFNACWIPDFNSNLNLSGVLGHSKYTNSKTKYIGALSRFSKVETKEIYKLMVLLSGPEPQRTILEEKLFEELKPYKGAIIFIKGKVENTQKVYKNENFTIYNFMQSGELEKAIQQSELILSRSGYTTIMDLAKLEKKAFFIPTPGQFEQQYLAKRLKKLGIAPFCNQDSFSIDLLEEVGDYSGFNKLENEINFTDLFSLF